VDFRITEKPGFDVIGRARKFGEGSEESLAGIPRFWKDFKSDKNGLAVLNTLTENRPGRITASTSLGVSMCRPGKEEFAYAIGIEAKARSVPADFEVIHVPAAKWAVFDAIGPMPTAIQDLTRRIFAEWFPTTGYQHPEYELEVYLPGDPSMSGYRCQVWIHVKEK
jgi:AraC family transcriptional regulator